MTRSVDILVVGAGQAAAQLAVSLRQGGYAGTIALVGAEPDPPYERPPLSKDYLAGDRDAARLTLRPEAYWTERGVELRLSTRVVALNPDTKTVATADSERHGYRTLVWATGGRARRLTCPGHDARGVHTIRTRADVDALRCEIAGAQEVAIVGGGYIGLETAAVLSATGKRVTVIEAQPRVLARVAGEPLSRFYAQQHRARGVEIHTGRSVLGIETRADGRVAAVVLETGERVRADVVICGVGIIPEVEVAAAAGASASDGLDVDENCRASLADVFAIGDCARRPNRYAGGRAVRIESVPSAIEQAKIVAAALLGRPQLYEAAPWFWSHQYGLRLQSLGLSIGYDRIVVRGYPGAPGWSLLYLRDGTLAAIDCINVARDFAAARALVGGRVVGGERSLADMAVPLASCVVRPEFSPSMQAIA